MDSGRITPDDVLEVCDEKALVREPVTTNEIAEELDCTRRTAYNKLDELADRGDVRSKKVGSRSRVWWRPADHERASDGSVSGRPERESADDALEATPVTLEGIVSDAAERERLETELAEVFGRISDGFYALDDQWQFTHVNERAEELIDYQGEGLVGRTFWEAFEWADDSKLGEEYRTAMRTQEPTTFEFYYPEPLTAWFEVHAYPSETGLSVYFQDVTERKERERKLDESERRYRALVEHFPNGAVALVDRDLRYRTVGGTPHDVADVTADELEGQTVREVLPPTLADELAPRYETALEGESSTFEAEFEGRTFEFRVVPIRDDDGDIFAALGMSQDITERVEAERKLAESERRYRTLVEHFPNGAVALFDENLQYTVTGGEILDDIRVSADEVVGQTVSERYPEEVADQLEPRFRAALDGETSAFEFELHDRHWLAHTVPVNDGEGDASAGILIVQDITERIEREQALRKNKNQLRALVELLPVAVFVAEADGRIVEWNEAAEEIWGGEVAESESVAEYEEYDGWWADTGEPLDPEDWPLARALRGEEVTDPAVVEIEGFDGERRTVLNHGMPVRDADGEVNRAVVTLTDVTEREERKQRLQEQNERLESFASMLAHELRNPVTVGQIYSQQLAVRTDSEAAGLNTEAVEYVTEAFDRIEDIIDVMLVLTRGREAVGEQTPVDLAEVARAGWAEVDAPEATLDVALDLEMRADETYIRHLFRNLFENAVEHGGSGVTITVGELPSGFYVADDGCGIPDDDWDTVFEAGYTTAGEHGGTGLGLAFVRELAEVYDWECAVTESADGGARFEFRNVERDR
ncbi:PAS domain-containing protein [Halorussus sp. MSC15.2]|uniref:PAS domain-containing protein n=1 Tax=Halorussus sp. MSC15.2 TaxID=2283638 RepID=UPI0013D5CB40|nr:PAS domain-containing protein [Halorussus sp. MSC15.2]NEU58992.1 PAS domain-containing protein [Halorussus sp. MSC15.2]